MRELCIDLEPETVEKLATEGAVAGFEDPAAYVQWLIEHRDGIDETPDRDHLLEAYRERFVDLKRAGETSGQPTEECSDTAASKPEEPAQRLTEAAAESPAEATTSGTLEPAKPTSSVDADAAALATAASSSERSGRIANTDGGRTMPVSSDGGSLELRGGPKRSVSRSPEPMPEESPDSHTQSTLEETEEAFGSVNLTPERVTRIEGDPVSEDATVLGSVETDRVDELSRRAVAKTRKRLNRDVETGLEYTSSTSLSDDLPLGEDVVDIETLAVPGRSDDRERERREVAGRAIAMLRDERRARKSDFVDALYERYPAGYDSPDSWWRCVKGALEQVDAIEGGRVWRFSG